MKWIIISLLYISMGAAAIGQEQPSINYQKAVQLYQSVITGKRTMESLTQTERQEVLIVARMLSHSCDSHSQKCHAICEAADQLKSASEDLATCAGQHDYSDSCDMQFNDVSDAHDSLESAISDADGDCE